MPTRFKVIRLTLRREAMTRVTKASRDTYHPRGGYDAQVTRRVSVLQWENRRVVAAVRDHV